MDLNKRITNLFGFLPDKECHEAKACIDAFWGYYSIVVNEQRFVLEKPEDELDYTYMKVLEKQRSEAHDAAINACSRLNELCREVNADKICDFDITDRRKVAEFCGFVVSELFYSNINCKDPMASCFRLRMQPGPMKTDEMKTVPKTELLSH